MAKALGLSPLNRSSFAGATEMLLWDTMCPSRPGGKAATRISLLLTALSSSPLVFCASLESKGLSAPANSLPGISGDQRLRENNTVLLQVLDALLNRN